MSRRIIIIEGNDNSGKTTTVKGIQDQFGSDFTYLRYPSEELIMSPTFQNCIYKPSNHSILTFIDALINEIKADFLNADKEDNIIIDRCFLSSLVYQGDNEDLYEAIKYKYTKMFEELEIPSEDLYHIILFGRLCETDKEEKIEVKKFIDSNKRIDGKWSNYMSKWYDMNEDNPYLKNIMTFKVDLNNIGAVRECIYHFIDCL